MTDLLDRLVEAHGGLKRWDELQTVTAHLAQGGALWALKSQQGVLDDVFITAKLHEERESHYPFGATDRRSVFTPERVAVETDDGTVVEALDLPRAALRVHHARGSKQLNWSRGRKTASSGAGYAWPGRVISLPTAQCRPYTRVAGIMLPTGHRIFPRTPEGQALSEPLLVSIDLSEITFA